MIEQLDLIPVTAIKPPPKMPPGPIVRAAEVVGECRFTLRRAWGAGPCILWHGLNPSKADAEVDDPTIMREIGFSFRWGFGSLVKTNFYPFVTPDPKELRRWIKDGEGFNEAWQINALKVKDEIAKAQVRVAAWGAGVTYEAVQEFMGFLFWNVPEIPPWKCLGTNADGSPRHTLSRGKNRVPNSAVLVDWPFELEESYG